MQPIIHSRSVSKSLLVLNMICAVIYFSWWLHFSNIGNTVLFYLLFLGEIYHVLMAFTFWYTLWPGKFKMNLTSFANDYHPSVDVFIPVAGEPVEVVRKTALAAKNMDYSAHTVYLLNDGYVANKANWQDMELLAHELNIQCITRRIPGGAKAGNINNGLRYTNGEIVVIFDADMVPHKDFLIKTLPYFQDNKVGFVQTPQYYKNYGENEITASAWDQQELFFGPIMQGKEKSNAAFICGTNVVIRRFALYQADGMCEKSIAEDFLTSLFIHQLGWKSYYVKEVLAEGLAPADLLSYYKQQLRWARGSMEILFGFNPLFRKDLTIGQKIQYLSSGLYYFNGFIVLIDILMPLFFLFFGLEPVKATTTSFALYFIPFMLMNLYTLYISSDRSVSFRAISFSQSSWTLQLKALKSVLLGQKMGFSVTPKQAQKGNFLFLVYPHLAYIALVIIGIAVAVFREGLNPSVITNTAWAVFNVMLFTPFIAAAYPWRELFNMSFSKLFRSDIRYEY